MLEEYKHFNEIETWFINLYNACYINNGVGDNIYLGENSINFYYNEKYILKEKLYRLSGKNKPEKNYNENDIIFNNIIGEKIFYIVNETILNQLKHLYPDKKIILEILSKIIQKILNDTEYVVKIFSIFSMFKTIPPITTIGLDLVSVQPLSTPKIDLIYLDYKYGK